MEAYKREMKSLREELEHRPYYVSGAGGPGTETDDKVDDETLGRQQRGGRDWAAVDDTTKVGLLIISTSHYSFLLMQFFDDLA